jgi:hypothetical protein
VRDQRGGVVVSGVVLLVELGVTLDVPVRPVRPLRPRSRVVVPVDGVPIVVPLRVPVVAVEPIGSTLVLLPVDPVLVPGCIVPGIVDPVPGLIVDDPGVPAGVPPIVPTVPLVVPTSLGVPVAPLPTDPPAVPPAVPPATWAMAGNAIAVAASSVTIRISTLLG